MSSAFFPVLCQLRRHRPRIARIGEVADLHRKVEDRVRRTSSMSLVRRISVRGPCLDQLDFGFSYSAATCQKVHTVACESLASTTSYSNCSGKGGAGDANRIQTCPSERLLPHAAAVESIANSLLKDASRPSWPSYSSFFLLQSIDFVGLQPVAQELPGCQLHIGSHPAGCCA